VELKHAKLVSADEAGVKLPDPIPNCMMCLEVQATNGVGIKGSKSLGLWLCEECFERVAKWVLTRLYKDFQKTMNTLIEEMEDRKATRH